MGYFAERSNAIGLVKDDGIVAGVIFENWNGRSIMAHMVAEGRLNRDFIRAIFDYSYRVCGVAKTICPVAETNERSVALVKHMGFTEEARLRDCSPQGDIVLFTLTKADCRFLGDYGQRGQKRTLTTTGA